MLSVITSDKFIKRKLLSHINSHTLFVASVLGLYNSSDTLCSMVHQKCAKNHKNFEMNVESAFNYFAKNKLKRLNVSQPESPSKMTCTVRKLNSKSLYLKF